MTAALADERMSDVDALVWNIESRPRNRTTIGALVRFDAPLDSAELCHRVERASRVVPRLRQRVVPDPLPIAAPRWSVDPDFRLSFHLRCLQLAGGDDSRLAEVVRDLMVQPFERSRPLWEFTHLTGLADGGDALLLKSHHAVSDGVGSVEMMLELFDIESSESRVMPPLPSPPPPSDTAPDLVGSVRHEVAAALGGICATLERLTTMRSLPEATEASRSLGEAVGSMARMLRPRGSDPAVPAARSDGLDLRFFSIPLDDLRTAGRRVGGTVNDAFVAAVALATAAHFGGRGERALHISVPINTRDARAGVGNHWAPGRVEIDLRDEIDHPTLLAQVHHAMRHAKDDPAHRLLGPVAAGLGRLPAAAAASAFSSFSSALDVAASNVPGSPVPLHLCGREVRAMIPFGPLSGCAINVTLLSHTGTAHIGVSSDPAAVTDPDRLTDDLRRSFSEITGAAR
ncbi:MAG: wax ester/triacylglycerol synthase family O-acyltransferase [Acidimicrobiales bacterium]